MCVFVGEGREDGVVCGFVVAMTARQATRGQGEDRERYREEKKGRKSHTEEGKERED